MPSMPSSEIDSSMLSEQDETPKSKDRSATNDDSSIGTGLKQLAKDLHHVIQPESTKRPGDLPIELL